MDQELLAYHLAEQERLNRRYPDGFVTPRFIMNPGDDVGTGEAFGQLVQVFKRQNLPVVTAEPAREVRYEGRIIPTPAKIQLGKLNAEQIESLYDQGFKLRSWMAPGP